MQQTTLTMHTPLSPGANHTQHPAQDTRLYGGRQPAARQRPGRGGDGKGRVPLSKVSPGARREDDEDDEEETGDDAGQQEDGEAGPGGRKRRGRVNERRSGLEERNTVIQKKSRLLSANSNY